MILLKKIATKKLKTIKIIKNTKLFHEKKNSQSFLSLIVYLNAKINKIPRLPLELSQIKKSILSE